MAYEVTATRRRPQQFEDLAGQEFVAETLKNSIKSSQIAHAYLFSGPRGCGKTSTARILAKALNCQSGDGPNATPCGACESCKAITNSSSLDVIEIDGASNTSVNDIRQIKDEVMFPPNSARYKIYIIDEVHMLSTSAFNALLKTIEEPPPYVIFIFATTELQKVPATIKSRCQQFNFRLVPVEKVKSLLTDACHELNIQADDEALYWIAKESGGSIRDSYTLFDQVAAFSDGYITYEKIRDKLGLLGVDRLNTIFSACAEGQTENAMTQLNDFLASGISIEQLISASSEYIRSLLLIKNGITKESLLGQSAERYSKTVLDSWNTIQVERALSLFMQLYRDIRYSLSPRYELELATSRLCWLKEYVSPKEVKAAVDNAHSLLQGSKKTQNTASPYENAQSNAPAISMTNSANNTASGASAVHIPNIPNAQNNCIPHQTAVPAPSSVSQNASENQNEKKLPHFKIFDTLNASGQGKQDPFYNGGAIPPIETVATSTISQTQESSVQEPSFSEHADNENRPRPPEQMHQANYVFTAQDGTSIEMKELFGKVIAELSVNNAMLASSLMQTDCWSFEGNTISTNVKTEYQRDFLQQNRQTIISVIEKFTNEKMQFEVTLEKVERKEEKKETPLQVKLLCAAFKGSVVGQQ